MKKQWKTDKKEKKRNGKRKNNFLQIVFSPVTSVTGVFLSTTVAEYFYNAQGKRIRTESYLEGKETTLGKTIEETVADIGTTHNS